MEKTENDTKIKLVITEEIHAENTAYEELTDEEQIKLFSYLFLS